MKTIINGETQMSQDCEQRNHEHTDKESVTDYEAFERGLTALMDGDKDVDDDRLCERLVDYLAAQPWGGVLIATTPRRTSSELSGAAGGTPSWSAVLDWAEELANAIRWPVAYTYIVTGKLPGEYRENTNCAWWSSSTGTTRSWGTGWCTGATTRTSRTTRSVTAPSTGRSTSARSISGPAPSSTSTATGCSTGLSQWPTTRNKARRSFTSANTSDVGDSILNPASGREATTWSLQQALNTSDALFSLIGTRDGNGRSSRSMISTRPRGRCERTTKTISILDGIKQDDLFALLIHEIAHAVSNDCHGKALAAKNGGCSQPCRPARATDPRGPAAAADSGLPGWISDDGGHGVWGD